MKVNITQIQNYKTSSIYGKQKYFKPSSNPNIYQYM